MLADIALGLLCLGVFVLAVTFLQHVFLAVPFIPTPHRTVEAMLDAAELRGHETVYDLGAGDARLLIAAKRRHPGVTAKGCELVWLVWFLARVRIALAGVDVRLTRGGVDRADVRDADVVFLYLFPSMMARLAAKFDRELRPGTLVVSHAFQCPGKEPLRTVVCEGRRIHVYRW